MDLQQLVKKAESEISEKREEADKYLASAREEMETAKRMISEANKREAEIAKFQKEVDKKISKLEELEEIQRSERDRVILKQEADELMKKAVKEQEVSRDKSIEADAKMKVAEDREARLKANAKDYQKKLKEAAIANLVDVMFKEV